MNTNPPVVVNERLLGNVFSARMKMASTAIQTDRRGAGLAIGVPVRRIQWLLH